MRKLFFGLVILLVVVIGILIAAPSFVPTEVYRGPITGALERSTGRDVTINGDVRLKFFPRLEILLQDVTVGNVPKGKAAYFAKIQELDVVLDLMALLKRRVKVDHFELIAPHINLEDSSTGTPNWSFTPDNTTPDTSSAFNLSDISLEDVRLVKGRITYRDTAGAMSTYEGINVQFSLENLDHPLNVRGSVALDDQTINLTIMLGVPRVLLDGGSSPVSLHLDSQMGKTTFNGDVDAKPQHSPSLTGSYDLNVPSLRRLSAALGSPIEGSSGFGELKMSGRLDANEDRVHFNKTKLKFDGMTGNGSLTLALTGARPKLTGSLALDKFDANAFTSTGSRSDTPGAPGTPTPPDAGWSTEPMDFSALRSLDAALNISAGKILFSEIKIGKGDLKLKITNGLLTAALDQVKLYNGTGKGSLTINSKKSIAQIRTSFSLKNIDTLTFLSDAMNFDRLEGVGDISYALTTEGQSQISLVRHLAGNGSLQITDGAWRGINLANLARSAKKLFGKKKKNSTAADKKGTPAQTPQDTNDDSKTDFAEMTATFTVKRGQVSNTDLLLLNPFLRVTGGGKVNLVEQTVNYRLRTKIVENSSGQGGAKEAAGFTVPIIVKGSLDKLSYRPDLAGLVTDNLFPGAASGDNSIGGLINGILGGKKKSKSTDKTPADQTPQKDSTQTPQDNGTQQTPQDDSTSTSQPLRPKDILNDIFSGAPDQNK